MIITILLLNIIWNIETSFVRRWQLTSKYPSFSVLYNKHFFTFTQRTKFYLLMNYTFWNITFDRKKLPKEDVLQEAKEFYMGADDFAKHLENRISVSLNKLCLLILVHHDFRGKIRYLCINGFSFACFCLLVGTRA
jgi:hypothetical protein